MYCVSILSSIDTGNCFHRHFCLGQNCHNLKVYARDFPGGTVVNNPPANAGDTGLIPGPAGSHMPRSN